MAGPSSPPPVLNWLDVASLPSIRTASENPRRPEQPTHLLLPVNPSFNSLPPSSSLIPPSCIHGTENPLFSGRGPAPLVSGPASASYADMAAKQFPEGSTRSGSHPPLSFHEVKNNPRKVIVSKQPYAHQGQPAIRFSEKEVQDLAAPFSMTLVGKFMGKNPPKINEIAPEFKKLGLKRVFSVSLLDFRHLIITLFLEEDFTKL